MLNQRGSSKTDTLIKLVLTFFISLFSFAVGTFLGKKFSDKQHKIAQIESGFGMKGERNTASISPDVLEVKPEEALTDADIASITEEFSNSENDDLKELLKEAEAESLEHSPKKLKALKESLQKEANKDHTADTNRKTASVKEKKVKLVDDQATKPENIAMRVAMDKNPIPEIKKKKNIIPKNLPPISEKTQAKFTVQIASYKTEDEAKSHAKELQEKGFSSFYIEAKVKETIWYRVSIGSFSNQNKAYSYMRELKKQGHIKSAFVAKLIR